MQYTEREIQERVNRFCENPMPFYISDQYDFLRSLILDLLREQDLVNKAVLFAGISQITIASSASRDNLAMLFKDIGFTAYENGENDIAEAAFKGAVAINGKITDKNNLAYVMRKSNKFSGGRIQDVIDLLSEGVTSKEAYCLINMALTFSIALGTDSDWKTADALIAMVKPDSFAIEWWQELGEKGDVEGHLVHLWLQRHKIIAESALGTRQFLCEKVSMAYPNAPIWLKSDIEQGTGSVQYPEQGSE